MNGVGYEALVSMAIALVSTPVSVMLVEGLSTRFGIVSDDAHKVRDSKIPSIGGAGYAIGVVLGIAALLLIKYSGLGFRGVDAYQTKGLLVFFAVIITAMVIGLVDDLYKLSGRTKVVLTLIPGLIVVITNSYDYRIFIPFIGQVNASIVYPIVIPVAFAVAMNAVNMVDTHNGLAPLSVTTLLTTLMVAYTFSNDYLPSVYSHETIISIYIVSLAALVSYLPFNIYPSRVFNGDVGSLTWGAILAFLAITSRLEAFLVMASMPIITNGFSILASIKGFIEHSQLKERPVKVDRNNNTIFVNPRDNAPLSLASLSVAAGPLKEYELVCSIVLLVISSSFASLIIWRVLLGG